MTFPFPQHAPIKRTAREILVVDTGVGTATITGTTTEGQTLTVTYNNDDPDGAASGLTYQWFRDSSTVIVGATATTYVLTNADALHTIKCRVNYTDAKGFQESIFTSSTASITAINSGAGTATLSGTARVGQTLMATYNGDDPDGPGTVLGYAWRRNGVNITLAISQTYVLQSADFGTSISCEVDYTDGQGFSQQIFTNAVTCTAIPGSQSFTTTGSDSFTVPQFDTLIIQLHGASAGGTGITGPAAYVHGTDGGDTTCSTLSLSAGGGKKGTATSVFAGDQAGGLGGTASGGNQTNTNGSAAGNGTVGLGTGSGAPVNSGAGGQSGAGVSGGAAVSSNPAGNGTDGNAGSIPGGGGSGAGWYTGGGGGSNIGAPGGGGGAFVQSTYTRGGGGAPSIGAVLALLIGAAGVGGDGNQRDGGNGQRGQIDISWS